MEGEEVGKRGRVIQGEREGQDTEINKKTLRSDSM